MPISSRRFEHWFHPAATLAVPELDLSSVKNSDVRDVAATFISNIDQLREAALTPLLLVVYARAQQSVVDQACLQVFGDLMNRAMDDPRAEEFDKASEGYWARWNEANSSPDAFGSRIFLAAGELDQLQDVHSSVHRGLEATLRGIVLGAWTAFEVMASDLWEVAVNAHPRKLASLKGDVAERLKKSRRRFGAFSEQPEDSPLAGKHIRLDFLQANGFDLSQKMGTVLRERFNFQVIRGIQEAYLSAFAKADSDVRRAIIDPSIDALAATRNVLAHRAGSIDDQFMIEYRNSTPLQQIFPNAQLGNRLHLSGLNVHNLVQPVLGLSIELIRAVTSLDTDEAAPDGSTDA